MQWSPLMKKIVIKLILVVFIDTVLKRMFKSKTAIQTFSFMHSEKTSPYFKFIPMGELMLNDAI
jgi:hypothetical protein